MNTHQRVLNYRLWIHKLPDIVCKTVCVLKATFVQDEFLSQSQHGLYSLSPLTPQEGLKPSG